MSAGRARERVEARSLPALDRVPAVLSPNRAEGRRQATGRGWTGREWSCLLTLWNHESQWNHLADNPTSSAFGIAQFMRGTWPDYGPRTTDPRLQIRYGLAYISDRYRTPCRAWTHWNARVPLRGRDVGHWY